MERRTNDPAGRVTLGASWMGLEGDQLGDLIGRQLLHLGATVTSSDPGGTVFHLDARVRSMLRRNGLTIRNSHRVSTNARAFDRNRGLIEANRRWLRAVRTALSVASIV